MSEDAKNAIDQSGVDQGQASDSSIVETHARLRRLPIAGSPVAFFTLVAFLIVISFGWFQIRRHYAEGDDQMYFHNRDDIAAYRAWLESGGSEPAEIDYFALGQKLYANCVACHMQEGEGQPGLYPPLADSEYVIHEDATLPIKILLAGLNGPLTVKGNEYNGVMVPFGAAWNDDEVAGIVTYIRQSWGNEAGAVTPEQVKAVRDELGSRGMYTADELAEYF